MALQMQNYFYYKKNYQDSQIEATETYHGGDLDCTGMLNIKQLKSACLCTRRRLIKSTNHICQRTAGFMVTKSEQLKIYNQATV